MSTAAELEALALVDILGELPPAVVEHCLAVRELRDHLVEHRPTWACALTREARIRVVCPERPDDEGTILRTVAPSGWVLHLHPLSPRPLYVDTALEALEQMFVIIDRADAGGRAYRMDRAIKRAEG